MPAAVQVCDHRLELAHRVLRGWRRGSSSARGRRSQRVVAPVVRQPPVDQVAVVDVVVDRQQLDGGDAQVAAGSGSTASEPSPA